MLLELCRCPEAHYRSFSFMVPPRSLLRVAFPNRPWTVALDTGACAEKPSAPGTLSQKPNSVETGMGFVSSVQGSPSTFNCYRFNGAGMVGTDRNNGSLPILYFSDNQVESRLYRKRDRLQFKEITDSAGLDDKGWATGVTFVDVNVGAREQGLETDVDPGDLDMVISRIDQPAVLYKNTARASSFLNVRLNGHPRRLMKNSAQTLPVPTGRRMSAQRSHEGMTSRAPYPLCTE